MNQQSIIVPAALDNTIRLSQEDIQIISSPKNCNVQVTESSNAENILIVDISADSLSKYIVEPITLQWKIPAWNVKGIWRPDADFNKRFQADWELGDIESRASINAPVVCIFGNDDTNILTFACTEVIHKVEMNAKIKEEDNHFYCHITLFSEPSTRVKKFKMKIRIDSQRNHFSKSLKEVEQWWGNTITQTSFTTAEAATNPVYSTWYQFHQYLKEDTLVDECKLAYELGYKTIIIDDGWQTNDHNRGYDFTGDWKPQGLSNPKAFVQQLQHIGMKVGFWYAVPFCGVKSEAYQKFKGKFLTEKHRWAPVFDPRYPEVRNYLVNIYIDALLNWGLDGFKLDFIDDFKVYPDTVLKKKRGMDFYSPDEATVCLLSDISKALKALNPNVFIELRQKYIGPVLKSHGNMFRAFDCPADATLNRVRIADIKLLAGKSVVHSDMITWHPAETKETAALQLINTLFGVPQLSVTLQGLKKEHLKMLEFYTNYWTQNKELLLYGNFVPTSPLSNYPIIRTSNEEQVIIVLNENYVITVENEKKVIDIINGKPSHLAILNITQHVGEYICYIYDCTGEIQEQYEVVLSQGILSFNIPSSGLLRLIHK